MGRSVPVLALIAVFVPVSGAHASTFESDSSGIAETAPPVVVESPAASLGPAEEELGVGEPIDVAPPVSDPSTAAELAEAVPEVQVDAALVDEAPVPPPANAIAMPQNQIIRAAEVPADVQAARAAVSLDAGAATAAKRDPCAKRPKSTDCARRLYPNRCADLTDSECREAASGHFCVRKPRSDACQFFREQPCYDAPKSDACAEYLFQGCPELGSIDCKVHFAARRHYCQQRPVACDQPVGGTEEDPARPPRSQGPRGPQVGGIGGTGEGKTELAALRTPAPVELAIKDPGGAGDLGEPHVLSRATLPATGAPAGAALVGVMLLMLGAALRRRP